MRRLLVLLGSLSALTVHAAPEGFEPPRPRSVELPGYPAALEAEGVEGTVELALDVDADGRVTGVEVVRSVHPTLAALARGAALRFEFEPARFEGAPVPVRINYKVEFRRPPPPEPPPSAAPVIDVVVRALRPRTAASSIRVRDEDFLSRPRARPADILAAAPGMYVAQHAGGGKANQYFLRGVDADHGTDVALFVDGVPVNQPSHGHGQGYADLHFVIPETVARLDVKKGTYFAELGDFATAGAMNLELREDASESSVSLAGDRFAALRGVAITSPRIGAVRTLIAGELYRSDGPFLAPEGHLRFNLLGRATSEVGPGTLSLSLVGYGARWDASGQIPSREVEAGRLDRFGAVDPTEGGDAARYGGALRYRWEEGDDAVSVLGYLHRTHFTMFSNFSFHSRDPARGDMIEQLDARTTGGLDAAYRFTRRLGPFELETSVGAQLRADLIDNGLHYATARLRYDSVVDAAVRSLALGAYLREDIRWTRWLRTELGLRADALLFDVEDRLGEDPRDAAAILSPKANLVLSPLSNLDVFANFGYGFHSNDARSGQTPLTRALGYELGARFALFGRIDLAASLFGLELDSEIVWVGDEGTNEAKGASRRLGAELELRVELLSWLRLDADLGLSRGRFLEDDAPVPLAPELTISTGLTAQHPSGVYGRLGLFHLGERPASDDGVIRARGFTRVDLSAGYRGEWYDVGLSAQNLVDADIREAQFATVSRLRGETAADCTHGSRAVEEGGAFVGCEDLNFAPGAPINVQGTLSLYF